MARLKNISTGPRGAYNEGNLVMAEPGQEIEADDYSVEWFDVVGGKPAKADGQAQEPASDSAATIPAKRGRKPRA